jgi:zona occludens toxin (predicted ATPase)
MNKHLMFAFYLLIALFVVCSCKKGSVNQTTTRIPSSIDQSSLPSSPAPTSSSAPFSLASSSSTPASTIDIGEFTFNRDETIGISSSIKHSDNDYTFTFINVNTPQEKVVRLSNTGYIWSDAKLIGTIEGRPLLAYLTRNTYLQVVYFYYGQIPPSGRGNYIDFLVIPYSGTPLRLHID